MQFKNNPFPAVDHADENGLLATGGELSTDLILCAYLQGIFPWPVSEQDPLAWFSPNPRGILPTANLHIPKSLKRFLNKSSYYVKYNTNFRAVIENCSKAPRTGQRGTWITKDITEAYCQLFKDGYAYSVEVYTKDTEELVGGLYGVCIGSLVSGESMYFTKSNASKFALISLIEKLKINNIAYLDTQMVTPTTLRLGAIEISRYDFIRTLDKINLNLTRDQLFSVTPS